MAFPRESIYDPTGLGGWRWCRRLGSSGPGKCKNVPGSNRLGERWVEQGVAYDKKEVGTNRVEKRARKTRTPVAGVSVMRFQTNGGIVSGIVTRGVHSEAIGEFTFYSANLPLRFAGTKDGSCPRERFPAPLLHRGVG